MPSRTHWPLLGQWRPLFPSNILSSRRRDSHRRNAWGSLHIAGWGKTVGIIGVQPSRRYYWAEILTQPGSQLSQAGPLQLHTAAGLNEQPYTVINRTYPQEDINFSKRLVSHNHPTAWLSATEWTSNYLNSVPDIWGSRLQNFLERMKHRYQIC